MENPSWWDEVFRLIAAGARVADLASVLNVPWQRIRREIDAKPELAERYESAKRAKADRFAAKVDELSESLEQLNPAIAMKGYMWLAQVSNPEEYGERKNVKVEKTVRSQHVHELREMSRGRRAIKDVTPQQKTIADADED